MPDHLWYFDDFEVGQAEITIGRTVTEADLVNFVGVSGIFEEIFVNAEWAKSNSLFQGRAVPGTLILVVAEGLYVQTGHTRAGRAFLGLDELRITSPVVCGDTIHVEITVQSARMSNGRPDHGILVLRHKVLNQNGVEVMSYKTTRMLACRPDGDPASHALGLGGDGDRLRP